MVYAPIVQEFALPILVDPSAMENIPIVTSHPALLFSILPPTLSPALQSAVVAAQFIQSKEIIQTTIVQTAQKGLTFRIL